MKLATRISSIRRHAWKQCRSCSADSDSMWPDSLARNALAGWIRSPCPASTAVTGCWASQSISRSGCSLRSSAAIATSRCACPSPIGEETYSARRRRDFPRRHRGRGGGGQAKSRRIRFARTGSRRCGPCPDPSSSIRTADGMALATAAPRAGPTMPSCVPWITSTGQRTCAQSSSTLASSLNHSASMPRRTVAGSVSRAHPTASSICLVECGSVKACAKKKSTNPGQSRSQ